jgi:hypothetical protein
MQLGGCRDPRWRARVRLKAMIALVAAMLAHGRTFFIGQHRLGLEIAALRQQLVAFKRRQSRPRLRRFDRLFSVGLRCFWCDWRDPLIIVDLDSVISWHRAGFRLFWRLRSQSQRPGCPKIPKDGRPLLRRTKAESPSWGAPRIRGELCSLDSTSLSPLCPGIAPTEAPT